MAIGTIARMARVFAFARDNNVPGLAAALEAGESANSSHVFQVSALLMAATNGHEEAGLLLLSRGASAVNEADSSCSTALHWAARRGLTKLAVALVARGASPTARDNFGKTPLEVCASEALKTTLIAAIVKAAQDEIARGPPSSGGPVSSVAAHVSASSSVSSPPSSSPAASAAAPSSIAAPATITGAGPLGEGKGEGEGEGEGEGGALAAPHPIFVAVQAGTVAQVNRVLRESPSAVNEVDSTSGLTPLLCAAATGDVETVQALLAAGAVPTAVVPSTGDSALHVAAARGHFYAVTVLARAGVGLTIRNKAGKAAWDLTTDRAVVNFLSQYRKGKGDSEEASVVNQTSSNSSSDAIASSASDALEPEEKLFRAAEQGDIKAVKALINNQVSMEARFEGRTACYAACEAGHLECVIALVKAGADLTVRNAGKMTMLHVAVANGHVPVVSVLLSAGLSPNDVDGVGRRVSEVIKRSSDTAAEMRALLTGGVLDDDDISGMVASIQYMS